MATNNKVSPIKRSQVVALVSGSTTVNEVGAKSGIFESTLVCRGQQKKLFGSQADGTSNIMGLVSMIETIKALKSPCELAVYTANNYVLSIAQSFSTWRERGFKRLDGKPMANLELWQQLFEIAKAGHHKVTFHHQSVWGKDDLTRQAGVTIEEEVALGATSSSTQPIEEAVKLAEQVDPSVVDLLGGMTLQEV